MAGWKKGFMYVSVENTATRAVVFLVSTDASSISTPRVPDATTDGPEHLSERKRAGRLLLVTLGRTSRPEGGLAGARASREPLLCERIINSVESFVVVACRAGVCPGL